jgi:aminopeptidase C
MNTMKYFQIIIATTGMMLLTTAAMAQEHLQRNAKPSGITKTFTTVKELPITRVKNQYRSGTCWAYATLGYFESEILRQTGKTYHLCEMFVVNKDYMDCATHYVRMHGYSQISEGGSCDDVLAVMQQWGICPENAMPAPGSLTGDSLANFKVFFPELERTVRSTVVKDAKKPLPHWQDSVQAVIERYVGRCPESFVYDGKTFTPKSFAESLGLNLDDYVSLTSFTHHPFNQWFVI